MKKLLLIAAMFSGIYANAFNVKAIIQGPLCHGDATGSISVVMDGGVSPYTYLWSNGATTPAINNLAAGSYTVTVTDNIGATAASIISIAQPFALDITELVIDANPAGTNSGAIMLTMRGGTPDYSFAWSNGATTKDISGLYAGNYTVSVTDGVGCQASETFTVSEMGSMIADGGHSGDRLTGIEETGKSTFTVYPNPATTAVNLKMSEAGDAEYSIINAYGEVLVKQSFSTIETKADVSNLPAGNYLVQIKIGNRIFTKNIVVAK